MGGKRHSIYISTDPNNLAPIGIPGQSIFIGSPGPTIYGRGPAAIDAGELILDMTGPTIIDLSAMQIQVS